MKIYSLFIFFVFCCILASCSADDNNFPLQQKKISPSFTPSIDQSTFSKDSDTLNTPGDPIPPKGKG